MYCHGHLRDETQAIILKLIYKTKKIVFLFQDFSSERTCDFSFN